MSVAATSVTATRDWFFQLARDEIELGSWYNPWYWWKDWDSTMYTDCSQVPNHLTRRGANCASFFNWIRCWMNLDPIGGTGAYNDNYWWVFWEYFNINKDYPPFTVLVAPYGGPDLEDQGHVAIVSTWEDYETRNQWLIQSDASDWLAPDGSWGRPGPNEKRTMWRSHQRHNFKWAGVIVDQWILDGFPGFEGHRGKERAMWTAECMEQLGKEFEVVIPRFYAANMVLTENTPCLDPNTEYNDIRDAPGYLDPVNGDYYGPGRMSASYWPMPWSFTITVACFARALAKHAHSEGITELPSDKQGAAEAIQAIWKSFDSTVEDYAAKYDWACELTEFSSSVPPEGTPTEPVVVELAEPVVDENDVDIMARTIYGEARGEPDEGKIAVGWTIMNRVAFAQAQGGYWWGNTIRDVCLKPWQYSCWNPNDPNSELIKSVTPEKDPEYPAFSKCLDVARDVISGRVPDPVDGATHYYATWLWNAGQAPSWAEDGTYVAQIGGHYFYKDVP